MKKKIIFCLAIFPVIAFLLYVFSKKSEIVSQSTEPKPFFISLPLTFSSIRSPFLNVQIDDQIFSLEFDLGFRGHLSIPSGTIDKVSSKIFLGSKPMYGFRGKEYQTKLYRLPKAKIGKVFFESLTLQERHGEACSDSIVLQNPLEDVSEERTGLIGWQLFRKTQLLIDTKHGEIGICDSLETLKKKGYRIEDFVKTPLLIDRGLVEFIANTEKGPLRCVLDTGSTWNILNAEIQEGRTVEELMWDPSNVLKHNSFLIGEKEFGSPEFHCIPIKIPISIDAILGMEFFDDHLILIDFPDKQLYVSKSHSI